MKAVEFEGQDLMLNPPQDMRLPQRVGYAGVASGCQASHLRSPSEPQRMGYCGYCGYCVLLNFPYKTLRKGVYKNSVTAVTRAKARIWCAKQLIRLACWIINHEVTFKGNA